MLLREIAGSAVDSGKLSALSQFLANRAEDTGSAQKTISLQSFLKLAGNMGISITADQLRDEIQRPPLSNLIDNIEGDDQSGVIIFKGSEPDAQKVAGDMTVDQARQTVDRMAKRAASKSL